MAPIDSPRHSDIWFNSKGKNSPHTPNVRKGSITDPCKILEPKRKTLQSLEAERIMTVFHETVTRMEITTALPYILESLPRFSVVLGKELTKQLENHLRLQNAYKDVLAQLERISEQEKELESRTAIEQQNKSTDGEVLIECPTIKISCADQRDPTDVLKQEAESLAHGIKYSLKEILRFFGKNPKAIETITGSKLVRSQNHLLFMDSLKSLESIMKERLLMTPAEERDKKMYLTDVINREMKTNATREKLELKYNAAVKAKESEIAQRDETIFRLQNELQLVQKLAYDQQRRTLTEACKQTSNETRTSKAKAGKYYEDMIQCKKKIQEDRRENRENETHLRKRRFKMATEVYNWVQKYDADLDGRQDEYDLYTRMYEADKKELAQLQAHFEVLEKQYDAIMEERRLLEEEKARKLEEERKQIEAASVIQAVWRGYQFRKLMRSKTKKTGKKGKGNKKK